MSPNAPQHGTRTDGDACDRPLNTTDPAIDTPPPSAAADATMVRTTPSSPTLTEVTAAGNFGKYVLLGELARGGMGVVYRARQKGLDRLVALKMILATGADKEAAQRFMQEARAAAAIDHPNVVPIYDIDEVGGSPYFTMALVEGPNLRGHVEALGVVPVPVVVALFGQIAAGVAHAHQNGIVHRDLKPANVLIDKDGRPRVTDFGLAKRSSDAQLTATGQVVGTPAYMAPEQARDSKDVGPPADVYSLGAVLYFLLTGKPPFHAESVTDLLIKVVMEPPVPPREFRSDVPPDIEELCLRCLAKAPADRFADAQELLAAFAPITDQYLTPSANLTPSVAKIAFPKARTVPSVGSIPFPNATDSVPSLRSALPQFAAPVAAPASVAEPESPPVSVAKSSRKAIALAAVAVVLLCAAGYLGTRDKVPPTAPTAADVPAPAPEAARGQADAFAWPAPGRTDFDLNLALEAPAANKAADGSIQLVTGTVMQIRVKAARDCRVSVWVLDPSGQVTRLFPNEDDPDDRLVANTERLIPGNTRYTLETTPTEGTGRERLRVIATTGDQPAFPAGAKAGRFTAFTAAPDREKLASAVRGIVKKSATSAPAADGAVSEAELLFRVQK